MIFPVVPERSVFRARHLKIDPEQALRGSSSKFERRFRHMESRLRDAGKRLRDFSLEELDLIKTIADQVASSISNLKLSEGLRQAKEMEAFQTVAAFFVHDLKNLASKLSMTLQNLPVHFDNPEYRADALNTLSHSVGRIDTLCSRLNMLQGNLEIRTSKTNLNEIVRNTLSSFDGVLKGRLVRDLGTLPDVPLDGDQIQKVINNLLINANEAVAGGGSASRSCRR